MLIEKTVIGSFPKLRSPLEAALREVVELQLRYGVDLITDGEQRANMIQYFEQIPGTEKVGSGLRIVGKINPLKPDKLDEFYKIKDNITVQSMLKGMRKQAKTKITLTGPMTLGTIIASTDINSAAENYDLDQEETLFTDFSNALLPIVDKALSVGAYVQVDEPSLSTGQVNVKTAEKILGDFSRRLPTDSIKEEKVSCHVCGSIRSVAGLYDALLGLDIPILSFGFSGEAERENFDVVSKASLEQHGKKLGAGFISNVIVEEDGVILERLRRIVEIAGRENIRYIHPDCGFGLTRLEKVRLILEKMQKIGATIM
jgi:5-methyltetrahydropteroyltriglutamate--homocysteine methyltransferase